MYVQVCGCEFVVVNQQSAQILHVYTYVRYHESQQQGRKCRNKYDQYSHIYSFLNTAHLK